MKIELFKILRKKEFLILMCMLSFPILFSLLMSVGVIKSGDIATGPLSLPNLVTTAFGFFEQIGALGLITGILAVSILSTEVDNHHVLLYFPRISSRKRLYTQKALALTISFTIWFLCFVLVACLSYLVLVLTKSSEVSGLIIDEYSIQWLIALLGIYVYVIFIMQFALFLGAYLKPIISILCLLGIIYGSLLLSGVPWLGYLFPVHYMQSAMDGIGKVTGTPTVLINYAASIVLSLIYVVLFNILGRKRISRIEV